MKARARQERREISSLRIHPRQAECFGLPDEDDPDIAELAEDIGRRGLKERIEIRPDGTVISGHRRLAAVRRLGWTIVEVIVRYDLDEPGAEAEFLKANLLRRGLTRLQKARLYSELFALENGAALNDEVRREALRRAAGRTNESPKNFQRYLDVMNAPLEVQNAFDRGEVTLVQAARAGRLPAEAHARILTAANQGISFKDAIARELEATNRPSIVNPAVRLKQLLPHLRELLGRSDELLQLRLYFMVEADWPRVLRDTATLLRKLAPRSQQAIKERAADGFEAARPLDHSNDFGMLNEGL